MSVDFSEDPKDNCQPSLGSNSTKFITSHKISVIKTASMLSINFLLILSDGNKMFEEKLRREVA